LIKTNQMKKISLLLLIVLMGCTSNKEYVSKIRYAANTNVNLYAFIGKKISVIEFDPNDPSRDRIVIDSITKDTVRMRRYVMDQGFKCKYQVLYKVFNNLNKSVVDFEAYDHYGRPGFENYDHVLLYLSVKSDSSGYFHQKYQFDPVKKNGDGTWTGLNGESIESLFKTKKKNVFSKRGLFE